MKFTSLLLQTILISVIQVTVLQAQSPGIICPAGPVEFCDYSTNDDKYWNADYWWDPLISSHNLGEVDAYFSIYSTAGCGNAADLKFRYILSLDLDYNGVYESFIDSDSLPAANTIFYNNKPDHLFSGTARQFDFRAVQPEFKMGFGIATEAIGDSIRARVIWKNSSSQSTVLQMPYGAHRIQWIVTNSCGEVAECTYTFTAKDCKKPTVVTLNGLAVNLMNLNPPMVQLWASDFLQYTEDNFTPSVQLKIGVRRSGTGTGFPYNPDGTPQTSIQFTCEDLGTQLVELWSVDKSGNADFGETYVLIQDNLGVCGINPSSPSGRLTTPPGEGMPNVGIDIPFTSNGIPGVSTIFTDEDGYFTIPPLPMSSNLTLTPTYELNPLNGVNTFDLMLISRHILHLELFNDPYKMINADANKSGTVTVFDILEIRRLILGHYTELPYNSSWRFVDKSQVFADPNNPFTEVIRENILIVNGMPSGPLDFIGCKTGDVDYTAVVHFQGETEERFFELATIALHDRQIKAGETFTIHLQTPTEIGGSQMTFSGKGLEINKIKPSENCTMENFGLFGSHGSPFNTPLFTAAFERGVAEFEVEFTATQDGTLSEMLNISNDITPAMAFSESGERYDLALHFIKENEPAEAPVFYQNTPNPWQESSKMQFLLPEEGDVNIVVTDQNGSTVLQQKAHFSEGLHQVVFEKSQFPASGVYYVRMQTRSFSAVQKMMLFKN